MRNRLDSNKGFALFVVLGILVIAIVLTNVVLSLILNHARLTQHQTGRIQGYYAALAGVNVALENLRTGVWSYVPDPAHPGIPLGNDCADPGIGVVSNCRVTDPDFNSPDSPIIMDFDDLDAAGVAQPTVEIVFCPVGSTCKGSPSACTPPPGSNLDFCIDSTTTYITRTATPTEPILP